MSGIICHPCDQNGPYLIGRGDKIRTCDPLHPMQVRYQAAPRPDRKPNDSRNMHRKVCCAACGARRDALTAQNLDELLELEAHLMDELLALIEIHLRIIAREAIARAADGEALLV